MLNDFSHHLPQLKSTMYQPPTICHWGLSYKNSSVALREQLYLDESTLIARLNQLISLPDCAEALILQTCHRFEVWWVVNNYSAICPKHTATLLHTLVDRRDLPLHTAHQHTNTQAITYLMKVVASLDSVVLGETQVTHQFKQAMQYAEQAGSMGRALKRLTEISLRVAKKIRRESSLSQGVTSLAHAAIQLTKTIYADLSRCHLTILGAGQMATLCVDYAISKQVKHLTIVNRSAARASHLAHKHPQAQTMGLEDIPHLLTQTDIIISCVNSPQYLITQSLLKPLTAVRRKLKKSYLFICDLAMPRSIDPALADLDEIYLFDIDDLKHTTEHNLNQRKQAAQAALATIQAGVAEFMDWLNTHPSHHPLGDFQTNLHNLITAEVKRTLAKSCFSTEHTPHLNQLSKSMSQKITAALAQCLNSDPTTPKIHLSELNAQLKHCSPQTTSSNPSLYSPLPPQSSPSSPPAT